MRNLVDGQEQVLVGRRSDQVGRGQEPPGQDGGVAEKVGAANLEGDHAEDNIFREGFGSTQFGDLIMTGDVLVALYGRAEVYIRYVLLGEP